MCQALFAAALAFALSAPDQTRRPYLEVQQGYSELPNAVDRAKEGSGYLLYPDFPRLEIVKEGVGTPNPELAPFIHDSTLQSQISQGYFKSLQVRDLSVGPSGEGSPQIIPFIVSIKQIRDKYNWYNPEQGTIEAAGELTVQTDPQGHVTAKVTKFFDSQLLERLGRTVGYNAPIDLAFAQKVAVPILEDYFNSEPDRIEKLLALKP